MYQIEWFDGRRVPCETPEGVEEAVRRERPGAPFLDLLSGKCRKLAPGASLQIFDYLSARAEHRTPQHTCGPVGRVTRDG